jgi:hypothetical protein
MPNAKKGKNTGKKISILRDELRITGAGIYAFMPWTSTDRHKKAVIKIGESGDLARRAEDYSTYFPNGVYMLGFITDIKTPPGTRANPRKPARRIREDMEQFIMDFIDKDAGGKRLYSSARVRRPNSDTLQGETEWVYCTVALLHEAFVACAEKFHGETNLFYLEGLNPDTGKIEKVTAAVPEGAHYTGKVIFKT